MLNHDAKFRYKGRAVTDPTRANAALDIIDFIYQDQTLYVALLSDFNDTPDDRSLNTLESGIDTPMSIESKWGGFLVNLTEPLASKDHVAYRLKSLDKTESIVKLVNTAIVGSRLENLDNYSSDTPIKKALYDQFLVTPELKSLLYRSAEARVFDNIAGIDGNDDTRASDHLPVYVDFDCPTCDTHDLRIESLLPNPIGNDSGNEAIKIKNMGQRFDGKIIIQDASMKNEVFR